ncbi:MAG: phosphoglycerate dehydrogenase [Christensenellales bacterium]|jgi:phosphoglycerate dehydrogenase-like enzyme
MEKILITPRSFGENDPSLFQTITDAGYEIVRNATGGILNKQQMMEHISGCVGVIIGVDPLDSDVLKCANDLRAVSKYGVGIDNIDINYCNEHGIVVSRTVGANSEAVADYTMALILALSRKLLEIDDKCRKGDWTKLMAYDVSNATIGLLGFGAIGKLVAKRAQGFSMKVLANDIYWDELYAKENNIQYAQPEQIFREADFISLHLPLTDSTVGYVNRERIAMMKSNAYIINTARGGLIDEEALLDALIARRIAGAGLDAFATEPPKDNRWFDLKNVILGSHCAASTFGASQKMGNMATVNLLKSLANQ